MNYKPTPPGGENAQALEGVVSVHRTYPDGTESSAEEPLGVRVFLTDAAKVGASMKRVINTGNYEAFHLEASVWLPCYAEEAEEALKKAAEIAGGFILSEEAELRELLNSAKRGE